MKMLPPSFMTMAFGAVAMFTAQAETTDIKEPKGTLSAQAGYAPRGHVIPLTWSIKYPSTATDVLQIGATDTVTTTEDTVADVHVIGGSYTDAKGNPKTIDLDVSVNGGGTVPIFSGTQDQIVPSVTNAVIQIPAGGTLDFSSQGVTLVQTGNSSHAANVVTVVNGGTPPATVLSNEAFVQTYVGSDGKVTIGPRDVLYFVELGQTDINHSGFDNQDLVVLATYSTDSTKSNNGHGNNVDGVDSSNPGQGKTELDTNTTDDETRVRATRVTSTTTTVISSTGSVTTTTTVTSKK